MERAGVFIGVDRVGGTFADLNDAAGGAKRMHDWALSQGMTDGETAFLLTDDTVAELDVKKIKSTVKGIIDGPGVDQLVIYFAGHGLNVNMNETWLLAGAPEDQNAAISVAASVEAARYGSVPNVVFISDACRSAASGIVEQRIQGQAILPNVDGDRAQEIDQLYACALGKTAAEIADRNQAVRTYSALYTGVLLDGISGRRAEVASAIDGELGVYVLIRTLEKFLEVEVPKVVVAKGLLGRVNQRPDKIIVSDQSWLARFDHAGADGGPLDLPVRPGPGPGSPPLEPQVEDAVRDEISGNRPLVFGTVEAPTEAIAELYADAQPLTQPPTTTHFESQCGFAVIGDSIVDAFAVDADTTLEGDRLVKVTRHGPPVSVLLTFAGGFGAVLPAIPHFIATLTIQDSQLVSVAYEPSSNTQEWQDNESRLDEVRGLRAVAAAASRQGRFRLSGSDVDGVAYRMRLAEGVDPSLAVYAAYAYLDRNAVDHVREMTSALHQTGLHLFDVELVARNLIKSAPAERVDVCPLTPMLSQGWAIMPAHDVAWPPELTGIEKTVRESLWSIYDLEGVAMIHEALVNQPTRAQVTAEGQVQR